MKSLVKSLAVAVVLALPAQQSLAGGGPQVTDSFGGGGFRWEGNGGLLFRFAAVEQDGKIFVCGAYTRRGASNSRALSREAMRQAEVTVGGQRIMRDLRFFTAASNGNWSTSLVGVETTCRSSGVAAAGVQLRDVRVEMREGRYRVRR